MIFSGPLGEPALDKPHKEFFSIMILFNFLCCVLLQDGTSEINIAYFAALVLFGLAAHLGGPLLLATWINGCWCVSSYHCSCYIYYIACHQNQNYKYNKNIKIILFMTAQLFHNASCLVLIPIVSITLWARQNGNNKAKLVNLSWRNHVGRCSHIWLESSSMQSANGQEPYLSYKRKIDLPSCKTTIGSHNICFMIYANTWMKPFDMLWNICMIWSNSQLRERTSIILSLKIKIQPEPVAIIEWMFTCECT